jgi:predicted homoserine dehydrogenase-like protein
MLGLNKKLKELEKEGKTISVAIAGMGQMGKGLISHIRSLKGMQVLAVANRKVDSAIEIMREIKVGKGEILLAEDKDKIGYKDTDVDKITVNYKNIDEKAKRKIEEAVKEGRVIVSNNLSILSCIESVDVVVDATGSPEAGACIATDAIANRKHVVTLNVEADITIGPILKKLADNAGVVYTVSAGDEPGALKELYDFADALGLEVVAACKGKNNPLDRHANPTTLKEYAESKGSSAKMMTSFVDGTKSMIEMACLSNATGLVPDCRGMHGPKANVKDLVQVFSLKKDGGILSKKGVVDFAIGDIAPGVFLVYTTDQETIKKDIKYLQLGDGPNYLLYRPYHLVSIETPLSIARAYFYNEPTIAPLENLVSEVITVAKKDLKTGEIIDGIGGYTTYGLIELYDKAKKENLLPIGLSEGCRLKKDVKKDEPIRYGDVSLASDSLVFKLRKTQEKMIY